MIIVLFLAALSTLALLIGVISYRIGWIDGKEEAKRLYDHLLDLKARP